jgi:zinc/manganese transport system substrate-binding protein
MKYLRPISFTGMFLLASLAAYAIQPSPAKKLESPKSVGAKKPVAPTPAPAAKKKIQVVTTLKVLASIAKEIGGDLVEVNSLIRSGEDPHFVKPLPPLKLLVAKADLFFQVGRSLEIWAPQVINSSGNAKLMQSGVVSVSDGAKKLEAPTEVSRIQGDIHPTGNPHIWLSALGGLKIAENIKNGLVKTDASNKAVYERKFLSFKEKLSKALFGDDLIKAAGNLDYLWRRHNANTLKDYLAKKKKQPAGWLKMASLIDYPLITYHTVWSYFADEFGLKIFAHIEEKPGIEPSSRYLTDLIERAKENNVKYVFDASYYIGASRFIDKVVKQLGGKKLLVDADCLEGESFVAMMDRLFKSLVDLKSMPAPPPPKKT